MEDQENYNQTPKKISDMSDLKYRQNIQPQIEEQNLDEGTTPSFNDETAYSRIYHGLTMYFKLRPIETLILAVILSFSKGKKSCWYSQNTFAIQLNVSIPTINDGLKSLSEKELIRKGQRHQRYHTVQWSVTPQTLDRLRYIQGKMDRAKEERAEYKKYVESRIKEL